MVFEGHAEATGHSPGAVFASPRSLSDVAGRVGQTILIGKMLCTFHFPTRELNCW